MKGLEKRLMMSGTIEDSVSKMERLATSFQERRRKRQDDKQDVRKFGVRQELAKVYGQHSLMLGIICWRSLCTAFVTVKCNRKTFSRKA